MISMFSLLLFVSYLLFVLISESLNPFSNNATKLKGPHRKLGKEAAFSSLAAGFVVIALLERGLADRQALALYLLLTALLLIPSILRFRRSNIWH